MTRPDERLTDAEFWGLAEAELRRHGREALLKAMPGWAEIARPAQLPPPGDWRHWLMVGGRGSGKTRSGAEWVLGMVAGTAPFATVPHARIALVAETLSDAREVMIDGESGIRTVSIGDKPVYEATRRRLVFANGAVAQIFSSEDPDALRGYQFDAAWGDELAKWVRAEETFDNLQFGLRLGARPRALFTTTPKPVPLLKRLMSDPAVARTHMATVENEANLAPRFVDDMTELYGATRLARQELDGELIERRDDALFDRDRIEKGRVARVPELGRVVVAVDPPATGTKRADACGIVAAGLGADGIVYVLADASRQGLKPTEWAGVAVALFERLEADRIVAEVNQGGEMVETVIHTVSAAVPVQMVRASRGKWVRAEPVAALYEQGRVRHVGTFPALEDEMADFGPNGLSTGRSPDRLDALVWAVSALTGPRAEPRVRGL